MLVRRLLHTAFATVALPLFLLAGLRRRGWLRSLPERFLGGGWSELARAGEARIWLHGASIGELSGLFPLVRELGSRGCLPPSLITVTSPAAHRLAREAGAADDVCFLPVDHPWLLRLAFERARPRALVIAETEIWPGLLLEAIRRRVPVVIVNGRISDRSFPWYRVFRPFLAPLLAHLTVLAQTERDRSRFVAIGARASRVHVTGTTKYDREVEIPRPSSEARRTRMVELGLDPAALCLVAGSVHPGEDEIVVRSYRRVRSELPQLQLIIAPRQPERFEDVARLLSRNGLTHVRRSSSPAPPGSQVVLLDSLGELSAMYALASIAFVGGTLVPIGGHNPLEPAAHGVPVLVGPHTSSVRGPVDALKERRALFEVKGEDELVDVVMRLARDPDLRKACGDAGRGVYAANAGATSQIAEWISNSIERRSR